MRVKYYNCVLQIRFFCGWVIVLVGFFFVLSWYVNLSFGEDFFVVVGLGYLFIYLFGYFFSACAKESDLNHKLPQ